MQLHQIKPLKEIKKEKRIGRGGKRGTTSGKGTKGQKSRAGHRIRPAVRDLLIRIPKLKGFKNKPLKSKPVSVNIEDIEKSVKETLITKESLVKSGLIRKSESSVKILAKGEIKKPFTIKGIAVSESARKKIEAAGGKIES